MTHRRAYGQILLALAIAVAMAIAPLVPGWAQPISSVMPTAEQRTLRRLSQQGCLPVPAPHIAPAYEFSLIASIRDTRPAVSQNLELDQDFYYIRVHSPWEIPDYPWETLSAIDGHGQCTNLIGQRAGGVTLTTFMPPPLAGQLALEKYRQLQATPEGQGQINRLLGSVTPDPESYNSDLDMDTWIAPEEAWALQELGYVVPATMHEYPVQVPYKERQGDEILFNHRYSERHHALSIFGTPIQSFDRSAYSTESIEDMRNSYS